MHVEAGVAVEPAGDRGMLMGGVIVGNDVDVEIGRGLVIDGFKEGQPLLMAIARRQAGDQLALEIVPAGSSARHPVVHGFGAAAVRTRFCRHTIGLSRVVAPICKSFPINSSGFEIVTELSIHALQLRIPTAEHKTLYFPRPANSHSKLDTCRDGLRIVGLIAYLVRDVRPMLLWVSRVVFGDFHFKKAAIT